MRSQKARVALVGEQMLALEALRPRSVLPTRDSSTIIPLPERRRLSSSTIEGLS
jgi:hypothetical protein